jgi:glutathione S-transferase
LKYATVLNGHLACRTYVACGRLTIADFQMASMASDWRASEMPRAEYPNIVE